MKFSILFIILISISVLSGTAQNSGLQLTKIKNHKIVYINKDSKIRIRLKKGGTMIHGKYTPLNDSTILIQSYIIGLKQIYEIRISTFPITLAGVSLLCAGTLFAVAGLTANSLDASLARLGGGVYKPAPVYPYYVSAALLATGGLIFLNHGKKYASSKWQYKVIKPVPVVNSN